MTHAKPSVKLLLARETPSDAAVRKVVRGSAENGSSFFSA